MASIWPEIPPNLVSEDFASSLQATETWALGLDMREDSGLCLFHELFFHVLDMGFRKSEGVLLEDADQWARRVESIDAMCKRLIEKNPHLQLEGDNWMYLLQTALRCFAPRLDPLDSLEMAFAVKPDGFLELSMIRFYDRHQDLGERLAGWKKDMGPWDAATEKRVDRILMELSMENLDPRSQAFFGRLVEEEKWGRGRAGMACQVWQALLRKNDDDRRDALRQWSESGTDGFELYELSAFVLASHHWDRFGDYFSYLEGLAYWLAHDDNVDMVLGDALWKWIGALPGLA